MELGDEEGLEVEVGMGDFDLEPMDGPTQMAIQNRLSTQERLRLAKRRRAEQLKRWSQREREWKKQTNVNGFGNSNISNGRILRQHQGGGDRRVGISFEPSVVLLEAAARNDLDEVKALLEAGVSPDSTNEDGLTALHQCCIDDSEEMMKILVGFGGNPNATDTEKWTPLHAAATCGHLHLVKFLIDSGANLLSVNADGNMPYDLCEDETTLSYIENEMARRGVTQELIDDTRSQTERQMLNDLQLLQMDGGDLDSKDSFSGASPLHIASANGYLSVVEFLLDHHVSTEVADQDGWMPMHAAAYWGQLEVVNILNSNGADINPKLANGKTPFDICQYPQIQLRLIELKEQRIFRTQANLNSSGSSIVRNYSVRRSSMREKLNTTKRDVQDEKLFFMKKLSFDDEINNNQNKLSKNDKPSVNGGSKSDIVDLKDVELTLIPSYLQEPTDNDNQTNSSMVELLSSSKNIHSTSSTEVNQNSTSPPQRPPRQHGNQDANGGSPSVGQILNPSPSRNSHITVKVTNHDTSSSSPEKISPENKMRASNSFTPAQMSGNSHTSLNSISNTSQPQSQTLSDLKKQRSMSRVKQHSPNQDSSSNAVVNQSSPNGPNSKAANISLVGDPLPAQSLNLNSSISFHSQNTESPTTLLKTSSSRNNEKKGSSRKSKAKAPTHPKAPGKNVRSSKSQQENSDNINIDSNSGNHRSSKKSSSRSSSNVKKYSAGTNEVVGPPQKKTGCCRVM